VTILAKVKLTRQDLIAAYDAEGSFDGAAYALGINRKTFSKMWREKIGAPPPKSTTRTKKVKVPENSDTYSIALISDMHFGSKYTALEELSDFCRTVRKRGIKTILCAGDLSDGLRMHPEMEKDQHLHNPKQIAKYICDNYPSGFENNYFITGNHDSSLLKNGCLHLGEFVAQERDDLMYLGQDFGMVTVDGGMRIALYHGTGGCAEVRSKRTQDLVMKMVCDKKKNVPHVLATGHCHIENVIPQYMGMMAISLGSFQRQTPYLASRMLMPDLSGLILSYQMVGDKMMNPVFEFIRYESR
jgi:predicted phosphodiesterase